jgi:hypothetical protein
MEAEDLLDAYGAYGMRLRRRLKPWRVLHALSRLLLVLSAKLQLSQ